eukprot:gene12456-15663_t
MSMVTIPGVGDLQVDKVRGLDTNGDRNKKGPSSEMDPSGSAPVSLAQADPEVRESLVRMNDPDPEEGEQTWPSKQELIDAEVLAKQMRKKKVPAGTSEYQAAWIMDEMMSGDSEDEDSENNDMKDGNDSDEPPELELEEEEEEMTAPVEDEEDEEKMEALHRELKARRAAQEQDGEYPDEVDLSPETPGRIRLQKYRGLKSFRSSKWDSKEWLPPDYSHVFAFENFQRTHKRAAEAVKKATSDDADPCSVPPGAGAFVVIHVINVSPEAAAKVLGKALSRTYTNPLVPLSCAGAFVVIHVMNVSPEAATKVLESAYVVLHLINVSPEAAAKVLERVEAAKSGSFMPLVAFSLMQHEGKLSVVNFGIRKVPSYEEVIHNKEELLFCTGLRTFTCKPVFSADSPGDKQKMERFLHPGMHCIATVYAPIMYPQLPLLAFKKPVRAEDGYPVRVNKKRATVRFMFHHPDDIRWFRPVELYTRGGRRGRITEPLGTHGGMKTLWDGPVVQQDAACMALYKRAFPKWPEDLSFTQ